MAAAFKSLPIIDISSLLAKIDNSKAEDDLGVCKVVKQLDQACREAGFFYVKGHGIDDSLIKEVRSLSRKFFDLPFDEKLKIKLTPEAGYRGYQRLCENITKGVPDMHEAIDCYTEVNEGMYGALGKTMEGRNQWPLDPPSFKQVVEEYINLCTDLSRKIMQGISLALGGSKDLFEGDIAGNPFWVTRIIGYPGASSANGPENDIGCGAHTDYGMVLYHSNGKIIFENPLKSVVHTSAIYSTGLLTLVNQDDDITALQVRNLSGEWISAPPIPGTFVCNIGDMLKILTNGLYKSTLHRVINKCPKYRVSVAYFYETNFDAAVEPLDICKQKTGGIKKFDRAIYGEHLVSKVKVNFVM